MSERTVSTANSGMPSAWASSPRPPPPGAAPPAPRAGRACRPRPAGSTSPASGSGRCRGWGAGRPARSGRRRRRHGQVAHPVHQVSGNPGGPRWRRGGPRPAGGRAAAGPGPRRSDASRRRAPPAELRAARRQAESAASRVATKTRSALSSRGSPAWRRASPSGRGRRPRRRRDGRGRSVSAQTPFLAGRRAPTALPVTFSASPSTCFSSSHPDGLPATRRAGDQHQARTALALGRVQHVLSAGASSTPASDERRLEAVPRCAPPTLEATAGPPQRLRFGLALQPVFAVQVEPDRQAREPPRRCRRAPFRPPRLHARGRVHRVAGHHRLPPAPTATATIPGHHARPGRQAGARSRRRTPRLRRRGPGPHARRARRRPSTATGRPQTAITASPMNFSIAPAVPADHRFVMSRYCGPSGFLRGRGPRSGARSQ